MNLKNSISAIALMAASASLLAQEVINIGVTVPATGPAASLGIPQKNTLEVLYKEIDGVPVKFTFLDDGGETAAAVKNMRKLISENKIDIMLGSLVTAPTLAMTEVAHETKTPLIGFTGNKNTVVPMDEDKKWVFEAAQTDEIMAKAIYDAIKKQNVKKLAIIGFNDAYGQLWAREMQGVLKDSDVEIVANESFARKDTSVSGQVLKILSKKPDAVLVATSGTPGALPTRELRTRGFKGIIYHTHGSANGDFLRVCSTSCEGVILPIGPVVIADQIEDSNPTKAVALSYIEPYEQKFGKGSANAFGAYIYDAAILAKAGISEVLKKGIKPSSEEFRVALRDALENATEVVTTQSVFNMTPENHSGIDDRSRVLVEIKDNKWVYRPDLLK